MARIIVIGAGVGGMATAARLAVKGHQVTILEQASSPGGKLATYSRDGFSFDTGPSLFTIPAVYRDLFLKTGAALEDSIEIVDLPIAFGYHFADGTGARLPGVDPGLCARALADALGPQVFDQWRSFISRAGEIWRITRGPFLQSPLTGAGDILSLARNPRDIRTVAPFTSLRSLAQQYFTDPRLITLVDRYATYAGSDPRKAPAALATIPYVEQTFGAWHIAGGLGRLGDALAERCHERGVELRLSCDVTSITSRHGRVTGVIANGEHLAADLVVANADASEVYEQLLPPELGARPLRQLQKATPSLSGFVMLLAVNGTTPGIEHHNVWFPDNYDAEFDAIFGRDPHPVTDPTVYACVPNDPLMRPDGSESWFILVNAPRQTRAMNWDAQGLADQYAEHVLGVLAKRGVDLRDRIAWREIRTPADLERSTRAPGGSIYGTSSNGTRAAFLRPANASPIPGLYLVGGSAHPGGGLPLVGMGAEIVANLIGR